MHTIKMFTLDQKNYLQIKLAQQKSYVYNKRENSKIVFGRHALQNPHNFDFITEIHTNKRFIKDMIHIKKTAQNN